VIIDKDGLDRPEVNEYLAILTVISIFIVDLILSITVPALVSKNSIINIGPGEFLALLILAELFFGMKHIILWFILLYQKYAPSHVRNSCLFYPSCSHYAQICLRNYGALFGSVMAIERLLRCKSPNGGFDYPGCGQLALFNRSAEKKPAISVLKNESPADAFLWVHPSEDFNTNSVVIVEPNEEVLFIIDGRVEQVLSGGRKYNLETENYPFLSKIRNLSTGGVSAFPCKVVFIRKEHATELKWGTDTPIQVRDPVYKISTQIQARGSYTFKITNSALFYNKMCGNVIYVDHEYIRDQFRSVTSETIKSYIGAYISQSEEEILGICSKQTQVATYLKEKLSPYLSEYGIGLVDLFVSALDIPANDPNRARLDELYVEKAGITIQGSDWERIQKRDILMNLSKNEGAGESAMLMGVNAFSNNPGLTDLSASQVQKSCPNCKSMIQQDSKFCPNCGQTVDSTLRLCQCGARIPMSSKFCPNCGIVVNNKCNSCGFAIEASDKFCPNCGIKL